MFTVPFTFRFLIKFWNEEKEKEEKGYGHGRNE